ncbi:hypothetical protein BV898_13062 [Hypsibius exemplaris]|uniref:Uncharacterized protein n=1 Tax=Hypsibius exemplaris TaxID=2072580 RepID=A0A1W0WBX0_HYPEX|nr:hypothetical protein BV898_13062 [Hypsibius exemplaris]
MYLISYDSGFRNLGSFHVMEILHLFRGKLDQFMGVRMSDPLTKSLHDFFRQIAHNGRADGPSFGNEGNYFELNQQAEWELKKRAFGPLLQFWKDLNKLPCPAA